MMCSNCLEENETVRVVVNDRIRKFNACEKCLVTYGKNRNGITFFPEEEVFIKDGANYRSLLNRILIIDSIFINEEFESGRCVLLRDKETNKVFTHIYDINWLIKIK
jgi:hypothetical protein